VTFSSTALRSRVSTKLIKYFPRNSLIRASKNPIRKVRPTYLSPKKLLEYMLVSRIKRRSVRVQTTWVSTSVYTKRKTRTFQRRISWTNRDRKTKSKRAPSNQIPDNLRLCVKNSKTVWTRFMKIWVCVQLRSFWATRKYLSRNAKKSNRNSSRTKNRTLPSCSNQDSSPDLIGVLMLRKLRAVIWIIQVVVCRIPWTEASNFMKKARPRSNKLN